MGIVKNISYDKFPEQGRLLGNDVKVCFAYDTNKSFIGKCVRDDIEEPFIIIFEVYQKGFILATECMYQEIKYKPPMHSLVED